MLTKSAVLTYSDARFPLVVFTASGVSDERDSAVLLKSLEKLLARRQRYVLIFDGREQKSVSMNELKPLAKFMKENEKALVEWCRGQATLVSSPMIRGALKAFLWLQPMPYPHEVCATYEDAMSHVGKWARLSGLALPMV